MFLPRALPLLIVMVGMLNSGCIQAEVGVSREKTLVLVAGGSDLKSLQKINLKTLRKEPLLPSSLVAELNEMFEKKPGTVDSGVSGISGPFDGKLILSSPKKCVMLRWSKGVIKPTVTALSLGKNVRSEVALSPDGKKLAYLEMTEIVSGLAMPDIRGNLMIYDIDSKETTKIGENFRFVPFENARWSQDGTAIFAYKVFNFKDVPNKEQYNDPLYPPHKPEDPIPLLKSYDVQNKLESRSTPPWAYLESIDRGTFLLGESVRSENAMKVKFSQVDKDRNPIRELKNLYYGQSEILAFWNNGDLLTHITANDEEFGLHSKFAIIRDGKETIIHRIKDSFGDNYQSVLSSVGSE